MRWLISTIEEKPFHDSKLFTYSLNDNKAKSRVIKITLVCVDVIYSHFRISVNCLNHFDWVSLAQMEIGLKHVLVILSRLTLAGFAKFPASTSFDTQYNLQPLVEPYGSSKRSCNDMGLIPRLRKGTRAKSEKQNIRLKADITGYLCFSHLRIFLLPRYSLIFGFPWTRPSVHSPAYQWNNCTANITLILSFILTRKYFDSTRFAYMPFSLSSSHALLEMKCDIQISYEMVSNAHVHQLTVSL